MAADRASNAITEPQESPFGHVQSTRTISRYDDPISNLVFSPSQRLTYPHTCSKSVSYAVWYPDLARAHVTVARGVHFTSMGHSVQRPSPSSPSRRRIALEDAGSCARGGA